jgi:hypothetical protein
VGNILIAVDSTTMLRNVGKILIQTRTIEQVLEHDPGNECVGYYPLIISEVQFQITFQPPSLAPYIPISLLPSNLAPQVQVTDVGTA